MTTETSVSPGRLSRLVNDLVDAAVDYGGTDDGADGQAMLEAKVALLEALSGTDDQVKATYFLDAVEAVSEAPLAQYRFTVKVVLREDDVTLGDLDDALDVIREYGSAEITNCERIDGRHKDYLR